MPSIRNSQLFKKFTDFFQLKSNDFLDSEAGRMLVPVVNVPIPPKIIRFDLNEAQFFTGIVVPGGKSWKILNVYLEWTSDVNAGNREIALEIDKSGDGTLDNQFFVASRNFQAASLTQMYNFFPGASDTGSASATTQNISIPPNLVLTERNAIYVFDNASIAVGDTVANGTLLIEETDLMENQFEISTDPSVTS